MKAKMTTNKNLKGITTIILAAVFTGSLSAQGLLVDGTAKILESLFNRTQQEQPLFVHATYVDSQGATYRADANLEVHPKVIESYTVNRVSLSFESEVTTEAWMSKSFANETENEIALEDWMTETLFDDLETDVKVEDWMTEAFYSEPEGMMFVEEWMTEEFYAEIEGGIEVESWMVKPLIEEKNMVEDWMMESFTPANMESNNLEKWMTTPFISEGNIALEGWMLDPLI